MMQQKIKTKVKAWVVSVDMGYGHQRAAYPLQSLAYKNEIVTANTYRGIPDRDRNIWRSSRRFYEFISRFKNVRFVGERAWRLYDKLQSIPSFYPKRDLSATTIQGRQIYQLIESQRWGQHLIATLAKNPIPIISTFFIPAFMAETFNYPGEIYCLATDADINRAWAPKSPMASRINYFAPNYRVAERLKLYGVPPERVFLTGFPLPKENTGVRGEIAKHDLAYRLANLDPKRKYWKLYQSLVQKKLGIKSLPKSDHPLTIMFAVGGAGAQKEIGAQIMMSLKERILKKEVKLIMVAGVHNGVSRYFRTSAHLAGLRKELGRGVEIIFASTKDEYFKKFNLALRTTDILWTKPSELSFYCALGIPIIIAPPIGSQEEFNRNWLRTIGSAIGQEDPRNTDQWLFDWIQSGWFAEAAMQGFIEAPREGAYNIEKIIEHQYSKVRAFEMDLQY